MDRKETPFKNDIIRKVSNEEDILYYSNHKGSVKDDQKNLIDTIDEAKDEATVQTHQSLV